jgi:very-short-patch-repair endonuclease
VALCQTYDLPTPRFNVKVCGYEVDALFESEKLIVELDSWEFHRDHSSFVNDRNRDADTLAAGYATVRMTWERPDDTEAARLRRILAARQ